MPVLNQTEQDGWRIYYPNGTAISPAQLIQLINLEPEKTLRNHHRSLVKKVKRRQCEYVVKQPLNKDNSPWMRFTTLYRDSEVLRDLKSMQLLAALGIESVSPVAALEKRRLAMVYESRLIYQFRPGHPVSPQNYDKVIAIMDKLHQHGYIHDDPHAKNFLDDNGTVFAIDCKPRRNYLGRLRIIHNYLLLQKRSPEPEILKQLILKNGQASWPLRIMNRFIDLQNNRRNIKNRLRKLLNIEHKRS